MVPLSIILAGTVIAHEVRISVIESNRFTDSDANLMFEKIRAELPPEWLKAKVNEIKTDQKEILRRLSYIEAKVKASD